LRGFISNEDLIQKDASHNIEKAIANNVSPDYFSSDFRGWLFSTITTHFYNYCSALSVDLVHQKIVKYYKKSEPVADANALFSKIMKHKFEIHEVEPLIDEVKNLYQIRKISSTTEDIIRDLKAIKDGDVEVSADGLLRKMEETVNVITSENSRERIIEENAFEDIAKDIDEIRDAKENPEKYRGIETGIEPLTLATNGWHGGELITVIGRPGQGKSIVMMNFAYSAWLSGYNVMYVTIEMPIHQQKRRMYSRMTGIDYYRIKNAQYLSDEEMIFIEDEVTKIRDEHDNVFLILDAPDKCSANFIEGRINNFEKTTGKRIHALIVDPIYLMQANKKEDDNVGAVSWDLKILARKLHIPVIAANQINREGHKRHLQGREMDSMDSASSDRLGQNTDTMLGIMSDEQQWLKLSIIKYRDGNGPTLYLKRRFDVMKIEYDEEYNPHDEIIAQITGQGHSDE